MPFVENMMYGKTSILSIGLIWRGLISDFINYYFLKTIHDLGGDASLTVEVSRLEAAFEKAYCVMLELEFELMNASKDQRDASMDKLRARMPKYFDGNRRRKADQFVTKDHEDLLQQYFQSINIPL